MPRWLWALIIIFVIAAFIVPNPAAAGATVGNAIDSMIIFFQGIATSVSI
jgi:hypothetical protein